MKNIKSFKDFINQNKRKSIRVVTKKVKSDNVKMSKIGGIPYLPKDYEYPKIKGEKAKLFAQINLEDLKGLEKSIELPESGILQFYYKPSNQYMGLVFDGSSSETLVVYHEDTTSIQELQKDELALAKIIIPITEESILKLNFKEFEDILNHSDVTSLNKLNYREFVKKLALENGEEEADDDYYEIEDDLYDVVDDMRKGKNHSGIGCYPYYTQNDIREYNEEYKDSLVLFQLDTDDNIMFGDCGVGNWFINEEDLKKKDFSKVYFTWDCC